MSKVDVRRASFAFIASVKWAVNWSFNIIGI